MGDQKAVTEGNAFAPEVEDRALVRLLEECAEFMDRLEEQKPKFDPKRVALTDLVISQLTGAIERAAGAEIIDPDLDDSPFDIMRHKPEQKGVNIPHGAPIVQTRSPGVSVGKRVFRQVTVKMHEHN